jgi:hypothetical protein
MNYDQRIEKRGVWALLIIIALVIAFALYGYLFEAAAQVQELPASKWDARIAELEKQAYEEAFKRHLSQLFYIWVTDNYQPKIPPKALIGARNARDAFIRTMEAIEKRQAELLKESH